MIDSQILLLSIPLIAKNLFSMLKCIKGCFEVREFKDFGNNFHHQFDYILIVDVSHWF